jgi:hypothetical protein
MEGIMGHIAKITPDFFRDIKHFNRWHTNRRTAQKFGISVKTALQVRGSNSYLQYMENVKAQHPKTKYSLADDVLELHKLTLRKDNTYITPPTAKSAVQELLLKV